VISTAVATVKSGGFIQARHAGKLGRGEYIANAKPAPAEFAAASRMDYRLRQSSPVIGLRAQIGGAEGVDLVPDTSMCIPWAAARSKR
jgi:hypothetical protein